MTRSGLVFNPTTGLYSPATSEIRSKVAEDWMAAFADPEQPPLNTEASTPAGQLIDSETAVIEDKNAQLLYLSNQFNPKVADGRWQDALGYIYFLERKHETASVVTVQLCGLAGTTIPAGSLVRTVDGITLSANSSTSIGTSGKANAQFSAQEAGPIQIPAHAVTTIVTAVPGWDSVDNPTAGVPGRFRESRSEFEQRRANSVALNAHGTVAALYSSIGNLPGVVDLVILENITSEPIEDWGVTVPAHGIFISVYGGEEADIAEAVYRKKDAGSATGGNTKISYHDATINNYRGGVTYHYNIERPTPVPCSVQVNLRTTATTPATIVDDVKNAILNDFNGESGKDRVRMASSCYASRFYQAIMQVGVQDLVNIKISASENLDWKDEVIINANQMPVLAYDDIQVNVVN